MTSTSMSPVAGAPSSPAARPVLAERLLPVVRGRALDVILIVGVAALTALTAQFSVHIPGTPVPVTGQTFGVLLGAATVGAWRGFAGQLLYIAAGCAGLPVFAGGAHGVHQVFGPTGGYFVGFLLASVFVGWQARRGADRRVDTIAGAFLVGSVLIYLPGVTWLAMDLHVGLAKALELGVYPFVLGDVVKATLAGLLLPTAWRAVKRH
ncbi:BioY protein [Acidothermus cellulolyticus 11B]|uniref:Biotin transporter n=1 Tax=Acidothermus cellulolyticus (strain ATCC 43068 / DSM 8971 / 11B) TaxID=351607 RepID=A0LVI3_ACIC1|nr:biotin transporter BioY [Acidothermus cellulolyticus]ABK53443.1 BioY protein [Acidothermus cellulolyticus 11B]